jgi:plasmid stabilization system protein ParE
MGRQGPEVEHETLRELIVENYRVIYQLREGQIEIITVVHSRRDLPKKFRRRGE